MAVRQAGLITRVQLQRAGVTRSAVAHRIKSERWQSLAPTVVSTTTGEPSRQQLMWLAALHAGSEALIGGLTAAELAGLKNWHRDEITVLVPYSRGVPSDVDGVTYIRSRRALQAFRTERAGLPCCRLEPALLMFAAAEPRARTALGALAAAVQQRRTTPDRLLRELADLPGLPRAATIRQTLQEIAGGADSIAELDVNRMCREFGLAPPRRQVRRRGSDGRLRFTDCEWRLMDGRTLVLEVDGAFHMGVDEWEDDLARQRSLTTPGRVVVRCTSRELRDEPYRVAHDLRQLGVPAA